jgi:Rrf2 family iron-responsive transcriptional regulator
MAECFEDGDASCPLTGSCDLNAALREALGAFFTVLESHTIAELAGKRRNIRQRLGLAYEDMEPILIGMN